MRTGKNPIRNERLDDNDIFHQVIIPVYIPSLIGYYKDNLEILNKCLDSLYRSSNNVFITVVNNGSCDEVAGYLNTEKEKNKIQEIIHTSNIGKLNAITKGYKGHNFKLITIADADTFFLPGWQEETIKVFENFPKAGTVGLVPQFNMFSNYCTNVIFENWFNSKMRFYPVAQPKGMYRFYRSLGWKIKPNHYYFNSVLGLGNKLGFKACIGSGHFVATYRKEVLSSLGSYSQFKLGSDSERILDKAAQQHGYWKLTTFKNCAYHMGNHLEEWMKVSMPNSKTQEIRSLINSKPITQNDLEYIIKNKLFKKFLRLKWINLWFLKRMKLPSEDLKVYPRIYY